MTKLEKSKAENLINEALRKYKESQDDWKSYEMSKKENNITEAKLHLMKFQSNRSYAEGIYQALVVLGFKHSKMKEFTRML